MKDNFLTIPCAPNYEINSDLVCRNKKTGKILSLRKDNRHDSFYYTLYNSAVTKFTIKRSPQHLRQQAVNATKVETFEPIPSLHNYYEINNRGTVRNAETKQIRKPAQKGIGLLLFDRAEKKWKYRSIADLLWEVFGRIPKPKKGCRVPCVAENNHGKFHFNNLFACAKFLAPKVYRSILTVESYLAKRCTSLYGWTISYFPANADVQYDFHKHNVIARRDKRAFDDAQKNSPLGG